MLRRRQLCRSPRGLERRHLRVNLVERGVGTESQPSPILAALAMAAPTCAPIMMGGRGACRGRGAMVASLNCQWRPECVTRSSLHSRRMISTASVNRLTRSDMGTP
jgi:hypothetical protein